ncbi:MAG TPA: YdcF family protein [Vicinamibacterales bacterium]|nr:YdcF family protein [Vicinamibacterales bacterium]
MLLCLLFAILVCSIAWARLRKRRYVAASAAAVFLYCWLPAALGAARLWEMAFPSTVPSGAGVGAIVVLAGGVYGPSPPLNERILGRDTYLRCLYGAQLAGLWPELPVVVSGGRLDAEFPPYAATMRDELVRRGVRADRIWLEDRSRTTYENALYTAALLRERDVSTIVLVTGASHMRRAAATFRKQGLDVRPAACAYNTIESFQLRDVLWPNRTAILWNDALVHEVLGIVWYRVRGRL